MSIIEVQVTAEHVRAAEVGLSDQYTNLFRAYPSVVSIYLNQNAKAPFVIRQLFNQRESRLKLADDLTVMRLLTLYSFAERKPIPSNCVLVDDQFALMLLVGRTLGYINVRGSDGPIDEVSDSGSSL